MVISSSLVANVLQIINLPVAWGNVPIAANGLPLVSNGNDIQDYTQLNTWHCGVVVITTAQIHSKPEHRFCAIQTLLVLCQSVLESLYFEDCLIPSRCAGNARVHFSKHV